MQEIRTVKVNQREVPVLLSDEKEALLAAKAAGRAVVGLWDRREPNQDLSPAAFLVEKPEDADDSFLERVARRNMGLPWRICETDRLYIREICGDDFSEIRDNQVGLGFSSEEEMEAYTENQYAFYGFGFWSLVEKEGGGLAGVAGLTLPRENGDADYLVKRLGDGDAELELGYHIFIPYRRRGFAREACAAILNYAKKELDAGSVCVRIAKGNERSRKLAESLGFM